MTGFACFFFCGDGVLGQLLRIDVPPPMFFPIYIPDRINEGEKKGWEWGWGEERNENTQ